MSKFIEILLSPQVSAVQIVLSAFIGAFIGEFLKEATDDKEMIFTVFLSKFLASWIVAISGAFMATAAIDNKMFIIGLSIMLGFQGNAYGSNLFKNYITKKTEESKD